MRHIIVFCYIFTILIGVSALTVQWLAGKGDRDKSFAVMKPFVAMLLVMNVYDFMIYYLDHITEQTVSNLLISIGDCLIAVLVLLWLRVAAGISGCDNRCVAAAGKYTVFYMAIWIIAVLLFMDQYWIRIVIDVPLIALLLGGSILCIQYSVEHGAPGLLTAYMVVITFFMTGNYISYFISETGVLQGVNMPILDFTIFYWLIINAANIILLYRRDFQKSYMAVSDAPAVLDLSEALEHVKLRYELTKRETEILEQIYSGKTNTQIAEDLFISESTVKAHVYNLFRKLGVRSRVEAVCIVREEKELKS